MVSTPPVIHAVVALWWSDSVAPNTPIELTPPFAVYGGIYRYWEGVGSLGLTYGRPICDKQRLPDGSRCSIFEGGHILWCNGEAKAILFFATDLVTDERFPGFFGTIFVVR